MLIVQKDMSPPSYHFSRMELRMGPAGVEKADLTCRESYPSSKNAMVRTSIDWRGGEASVVLGSSKAVWNVNLVLSFRLSKHLKTRHSSWDIPGYQYHLCFAEWRSEYVSPVRSGKRSSYLNFSSGSTEASSQTASGLRATAFFESILLQTLMNAYRPASRASTSSAVRSRFLRCEKIPRSPSCRRRRGAPSWV